MATTNTADIARMNAEFYRNLGIVAEDEAMLEKVYRYVHRLAKQLMDDPTRMSEKDYFAMLDRSKAQVAEGKVYRFDDKGKMMDWLNTL